MTKTRCFIPSEKDKNESLGNIFYEIQQLWVSNHLGSNFSLARNAIIESRLLHVRVLLDFFEHDHRSTFQSAGRREEHDDVLAQDFGFEARPVDLHHAYRARLNKDLAHLSYSRNKRQLPDEKTWPPEKVVRPLLERAIEFIDFLDDDTLDRTGGPPAARWRELRDNLLKTKAAIAGVITGI